MKSYFYMQHNRRIDLPIDPYLPELVSLWEKAQSLVVKASPGSGKTTRLPWQLAKNSPKKVVVLEPRRLAAKLAAQRIATEEHLTLGKEVGYHFRFERNISSDSRLIFYTEGTFLRLFLNDPDLNDVGTVILDEFHERHLETDVALAALRSLQERRPDLKLILMSATIDTELTRAFPDALVKEIEASQFKVDLHYLPNQPSILSQPLETKIKRTLEALAPDSGDVLVFVPGMREMMRIKDHLGSSFGEVHILHADLTKEEQEEALRQKERRKIILATNIAESSLTIPGIRVVIDSGIQREARYSPWTGLKTLEDRPVTQSSAIQRAGRAGRTADGVCFRLYAEQDFQNREPYTFPEILKADLLDTCLLVAEFPFKLNWLTPPPEERWQKAREAAYRLGALDKNYQLTALGKKLGSYPLDARLGRALLAGENLPLRDKKHLLHYICQELEGDQSGLLKRRLGFYLEREGQESGSWEKALLMGFPDQLARFRPKQHDFIHYSGKTLKIHSSLQGLGHDYYLILDVTQRMEAIQTVPVEEEWLYEMEPFPFTESIEVKVDESITMKRFTRIGSLPVEEETLKTKWDDLTPELLDQIVREAETHFKKKWQQYQEEDSFLRLYYWARTQGKSLEELEKSLSLKHYFEDWQTLSWEHLSDYFQNTLEKELKISSLQEELPETINLGGKRSLKVYYPFGLDPYVEAPIQDFYGVRTTPTIMKGKIPLTLKLLGPHKRPIQVTRDIQGFWKRTYQEMKKEWQREYPRHHWPDDPEKAPPILLKRQLPG